MTGQPSGVTRFGRYALHQVACRDLVSATYRATATAPPAEGMPQQVALRVVSQALAGSHAVEGFLRANGQVATIDHPHVLRVVDVGRHAEQPYTATVWRDGVPLSELIAGHAPLPAWVVLRLGGQIAEALDMLHASGIVHGTVGPRTVWVKRRRRGQAASSAAVTAFGTNHLLAAALRNAGDADASEDLLCVAPEQLRGDRTAAAADQYALACLMSLALTGVPPFTAQTNKALFREHLSSAPPRLTDHRPDLGTGWDEVFLRALDKDPAARFGNCRTLVREAARHAPPADEEHVPSAMSWSPRTGTDDPERRAPAGTPPAPAVTPAPAPAPRRRVVPRLLRLLLGVVTVGLLVVLILMGLRSRAAAAPAAAAPAPMTTIWPAPDTLR